MNVLRIAGLTFREALRKKALYGAVGLTLAFLLLYAWGTGFVIAELDPGPSGGLERAARGTGIDVRLIVIGELLLAGLYAVSNIAGLLAIFMAAAIIAQEVDQGTLHSVLAKPIARWQVVVGKWLGGSAMLAVYVAVTSLATALIMYWRGGYLPANLPAGILLLALKCALLFAVTMAGSAFAPAVATGIAMFIVYVIANVAGMVEQLGVLTGIQTMVRVGVISSLIIPSDALWKMASGMLQPPLQVDNPVAELALRAASGPFTVTNPPSAWMGVYGLAYTAVALGLAALLFSRRDL
jgi:ABC-type transport system involved in multi-copper enzyme maturation permease subunit